MGSHHPFGTGSQSGREHRRRCHSPNTLCIWHFSNRTLFGLSSNPFHFVGGGFAPLLILNVSWMSTLWLPLIHLNFSPYIAPWCQQDVERGFMTFNLLTFKNNSHIHIEERKTEDKMQNSRLTSWRRKRQMNMWFVQLRQHINNDKSQILGDANQSSRMPSRKYIFSFTFWFCSHQHFLMHHLILVGISGGIRCCL